MESDIVAEKHPYLRGIVAVVNVFLFICGPALLTCAILGMVLNVTSSASSVPIGTLIGLSIAGFLVFVAALMGLMSFSMKQLSQINSYLISLVLSFIALVIMASLVTVETVGNDRTRSFWLFFTSQMGIPIYILLFILTGLHALSVLLVLIIRSSIRKQNLDKGKGKLKHPWVGKAAKPLYIPAQYDPNKQTDITTSPLKPPSPYGYARDTVPNVSLSPAPMVQIPLNDDANGTREVMKSPVNEEIIRDVFGDDADDTVPERDEKVEYHEDLAKPAVLEDESLTPVELEVADSLKESAAFSIPDLPDSPDTFDSGIEDSLDSGLSSPQKPIAFLLSPNDSSLPPLPSDDELKPVVQSPDLNEIEMKPLE